MVPKHTTNQPTNQQTGGTQPTDEQTSAGFGKQQKTQEKVSFQAFTLRKQSCSLPCHCKAVRNTLTNTQVSQTSKTCSHARNNWGTWRGHNFHFEASEAIRGSVLHLIRLVFSHLVGSYLLYWHNCGVVTNSRQPTPTWPGFPAILQRRSGRNHSWVPAELPRLESPTPFAQGRFARSGWTNSWNTAKA